MTKSILVTGGAGYIGSHTVLQLLLGGFKVVVVDNLDNASEIAVRRVAEIAGEVGKKNLVFHKVDLRDKEALGKIFAGSSFDAVIHFAGLKAVGESVQKPLLYYNNNIIGTINLLEVMAAYGCKKLVFSSSATVYGWPKEVPCTEDFPLCATNPYGRTKLFIEEICRDIFRGDSDWNIILLRYFNPVGAHPSGLIGEDPRGIPNNLMPFVQQVAVGRRPALTVYGNDYSTKDGTGVRDYIHVVDLSDGHIAALRKLFDVSNIGCEVYNLGTGKGTSVLEMVAAFEKASGKEMGTKTNAVGFPEFAYVTLLAGDDDNLEGVIGLAKGLCKVKSAYPFVVAVLPDVPEEHRHLLESLGCILREIQPVQLPENQTQFAVGYSIVNYSKLRIWDFEEFRKLTYLHHDVQVYDNIDLLFDYPDGDLYAVMHCFCKEEMEMEQAKAKIGLRCQETLYFNAGVYVFEPSKKICKELLDALKVTESTPFAEEEYLNKFFEDKFKPLSPIFNFDLAMLWFHPEIVTDLGRIKVVHYCPEGSKPWTYTGMERNMDREDVKMLVQKWRDVYNIEDSLDYKPPTYEEVGLEPVSQQPFQPAA